MHRGQGPGLLLEAAAALLRQLPEAGPRPGASPRRLRAGWHLLKAVTEAEVVADSVFPALGSRPEEGEMLSEEGASKRGAVT